MSRTRYATEEQYTAYLEAIKQDNESAQETDFLLYPFPGKFEGEMLVALRLYDMQLDGSCDNFGEDGSGGVYTLIENVSTPDGLLDFMVHESDIGFFSIVKSGHGDAVRDEFMAMNDEYYANMEDSEV